MLGSVLPLSVDDALLNGGRAPVGSGGSKATGIIAVLESVVDICAMLGLRSSCILPACLICCPMTLNACEACCCKLEASDTVLEIPRDAIKAPVAVATTSKPIVIPTINSINVTPFCVIDFEFFRWWVSSLIINLNSGNTDSHRLKTMVCIVALVECIGGGMSNL